MNYVELNIACTDAEMRDILTAELADFPFESFQSDATTLKAYIPQDALADCMEPVNGMLARYGFTEPHYVLIEQQDWNALWERSFTPVQIGSRAVVRAPFYAAPADASMLDLVIMPRMAFGTGHHATTYLMTELILDSDLRGRRVLDVGCGTGVLAIAALKQGATAAVGVDIDDSAVENARDNAATNGVAASLDVRAGDVRAAVGAHYDYIFANINRNILLHDLPAYRSLLTAGGHLLLSGFLEQDITTLQAAAEKEGLHPSRTRRSEEWVALEFTL